MGLGDELIRSCEEFWRKVFGQSDKSLPTPVTPQSDRIVTNTQQPSVNIEESCDCGTDDMTLLGKIEEQIDTEASNENVEATQGLCEQRRVIVIDPGHGGNESVSGSSWNNATAVSGVKEKELTLKFSKILKEIIESDDLQEYAATFGFCDVEVYLTREEDINLTPTMRRAVATDNRADIFMSIHFNGGVARARGPETWIRDASEGAQSNQADDHSLATAVHAAAHRAIQTIEESSYTIRGVKNTKYDRDEGISVLRDPGGTGLSGKKCKTTLLEAEFITNPDADRLFVSGDNVDENIKIYMTKVAKALIGELQ